MKKFFLMAVAAITISNAQAQLFYAQGGVNLANITKNNAGETSDYNMLTTFNGGFMGRFGGFKSFIYSLIDKLIYRALRNIRKTFTGSLC